MLLIVAHHYVVNSGLTGAVGPIYADPLSWRSLFLLTLGAWGKTGINCFVMITGYFMCTSQITLRKFIKLLAEIIFYGMAINLIFLVTGNIRINSLRDLYSIVESLVPGLKIATGFTSCFLVFYLTIPFLNILICNLSEKQQLRLIILLFFIYVLHGIVKLVTFNYVEWFCALYVVASYLRLYPKRWMKNTKVWGAVTIGIILVGCASVIICVWLKQRYTGISAYYFLSDSNSSLPFCLGISSFLFFNNLKIPYSKTINTIAASTFGVLCIHANSDTMRRWLWQDTLRNIETYSTPLMPLIALSRFAAALPSTN